MEIYSYYTDYNYGEHYSTRGFWNLAVATALYCTDISLRGLTGEDCHLASRTDFGDSSLLLPETNRRRPTDSLYFRRLTIVD
jgi:hypothetical protein